MAAGRRSEEALTLARGHAARSRALCCAIHVERQNEIAAGNKAQARRKLAGLMDVLGWADT
jgi:hypothetical protein